jgi:hypothetical protein
MQEVFHLLDYLAEAFRCHVHHFQCLAPSNENGAHDIEKLLLETQVGEKVVA